MLLFIDTNVLLSFFRFTNEDLDKLDQLAVLAERKKLELLLPKQVIDEYTRNRETKIAEALNQMQQAKLPTAYAQICHQYPEYKELRQLQARHEEMRAALIAKVTEAATRYDFHADRTIQQLFRAAKLIETTPEILSAARTRHDLGNPPGKRSDPIGDAVNWEALLATCERPSELHVVADDKDWQSPLDPALFNPFLAEEWFGCKDARVCYYRRLTEFLAEHFPDITLASELAKDLLIKDLADSPNFRATHNTIRALLRYNDFTPTQLNEIVSAYISNRQVGWIAEDPDVRRFIESVTAGHEHEIDPADLADLRDILAGENADTVQLRRLVGRPDD